MFRFFRETLPELFRNVELQRRLAGLMPSTAERQKLLRRFREVSKNVSCPHNESHILSFVVELLSLPDKLPGCIVEAGAYKGGSTAKISLVAEKLKRTFYVFDSFEGLPANDEQHDTSILGHSVEGWFRQGAFRGELEEVRTNVQKYGAIEPCHFVRGWFDATMPGFNEDIAAAYLDVDLASSTRTCLKYLYRRIVPGGVLISQDGDFPLVIEVFKDAKFWYDEVGCERPFVEGLGKRKMLKVVKPGQ